MKLYMHPASATSRPILLFAAENGIALKQVPIDLLAGEHLQPAYLAINPNGLVPVLDDEGFRLSESSAILKYLADKLSSPAYPRELKERAKVNEAMDWFNANLYRDLGFNLVYPQVFPHHRRKSAAGHQDTIEWGLKKTKRWLDFLDQVLIGSASSFACLDRLTIADYFGAPLVTIGDLIDIDFSCYPNIARWLDQVRSLSSWPTVNESFDGMVTAFRQNRFVTIGPAASVLPQATPISGPDMSISTYELSTQAAL